MDEQKARSLGMALMEKSNVAYLSTIGEDGSPQVRAVENLRCRERFPHLAPLFEAHDNDFWTVISTNTSSNKIKEIKANPAAAVYFCDAERYAGIMLSGTIEITEDVELKKAMWHDSWTRYYPKGADDPDFTVLTIHPRYCKCYHRLEKREFSI